MSRDVTVFGLEILVPGINEATAFLSGVLGLPVVHRGPAEDGSGEIAVLDAGGLALTLVEAADSGPTVIVDRSPRLTQIVFNVAADDAVTWQERIAERGVPVRAAGPGRFFVPPEVAAGILGVDTALTFTVVDGDDDPPAGGTA